MRAPNSQLTANMRPGAGTKPTLLGESKTAWVPKNCIKHNFGSPIGREKTERAERQAWKTICRYFACDRTTAWRRWQKALQRVADALNGDPGTG
jgi:hypothetical protein